MIGGIALSAEQAKAFDLFSPHYGIHSLSEYRKINHNPCFPANTISLLSNWIETDVDQARAKEDIGEVV